MPAARLLPHSLRPALSVTDDGPGRQVLAAVAPVPAFQRIEVPAARLHALIARRTPIPEAMRQLGIAHVAGLVYACYRAGVEWPGLPVATTDRRVAELQDAIDHGLPIAASAARTAIDSPFTSEVAPMPTTGLSTAQIASESGNQGDDDMPIGVPLPIRRPELAAMVDRGDSPAAICVAFNVSATQLAAWCKNKTVAVPGLPTPSAVSALLRIEAEIAAIRAQGSAARASARIDAEDAEVSAILSPRSDAPAATPAEASAPVAAEEPRQSPSPGSRAWLDLHQERLTERLDAARAAVATLEADLAAVEHVAAMMREVAS